MVHFIPEQRYQIPKGPCCRIISVTPTDPAEEVPDLVLVVQPDGQVPYDLQLLIQPIGGGPQCMVMASEFYSLKPELVH